MTLLRELIKSGSFSDCSLFELEQFLLEEELLRKFKASVDLFITKERKIGLLNSFWRTKCPNKEYQYNQTNSLIVSRTTEGRIIGRFLQQIVKEFEGYQIDLEVQFFDFFHFSLTEFEEIYKKNVGDRTFDIVIASKIDPRQKLICQHLEEPFLACEVKVSLEKGENKKTKERIKEDIIKLRHLKSVHKEAFCVLLYIEIRIEGDSVIQILKVDK